MSSRPDRLRAARVLVGVVLVGLLGGTAAAFAITEQLKLERSPVYRTHVGKLLGPNCNCQLQKIPIDFVLRKPDRLTVVIVDSGDHEVRTLLRGIRRPKGLQELTWNGRDNAGQVVRAGTYKPRIHLAREHRTILMPNPIKVDPTAPRITSALLAPAAFSPDGDGRRDLVYVHYRATEPVRAILYVNGRLRVMLRRYSESGVARWRGSGLPAGRYQLTLRTVDLAGNLSPPVSLGTVRIRFISVRPHVLHAHPQTRIGFRVRTDAKTFTWRLGHRGGASPPGLLVLRAPAAGRYRLVVTANGHSAQAVVFVAAAP
ncbi:MAG TPA: FlgD immunoglobulin-like domain containing protein [Gaiellaceae bacterium]|nr:FlgD immunoglobulin-like domain containing protein [Gaiellaceae bacterium]